MRWAVAAALASSLVLNAVALLPGVPFLRISGVLAPGPYSILKVIELLWESGLYPLVALVVGFSVLFPPAKLALAAWCLWGERSARRRERLLRRLGGLGRWSLLDVFVCLLIVLVLSEQGLTGATVAYGLYCFLAAIVLSMAAGAALHLAAERYGHARPAARAIDPGSATPLIIETGPKGGLAAGVAAMGVVGVAGSFSEVMFRVDQFGLWGNAWSLRSAIEHFFDHGIVAFGIAVLLFLVIAPATTAVALLVALFVPTSEPGRRRALRATRLLAEWSMLDVFALAMMLYLVEQSNFAKLDLLAGAWFVFLSAAVFSVGIWWSQRLLEAAVSRDAAADR